MCQTEHLKRLAYLEQQLLRLQRLRDAQAEYGAAGAAVCGRADVLLRAAKALAREDHTAVKDLLEDCRALR